MDLISIKSGLPSVKNLEIECLRQDQVECPVIHRFGPGIYIREVHIPADTFAIGHYQKHEHVNIFLKGRLFMLNDNGSTSELKAPMLFIGKPGRKCGYICEDVVWLNIYSTNETDVNKLESIFLDKSKEWKDANKLQNALRPKRIDDNNDFNELLKEYGFDKDTVRKQSESTLDLVSMPFGHYKIIISESSIEGKGVFATANIAPDEAIGPAKIGNNRTPIGRYINHSKTPNAKMIMNGDNIDLIAISEIQGCLGGYLGDEITTNYRNNLNLIGINKCLE